MTGGPERHVEYYLYIRSVVISFWVLSMDDQLEKRIKDENRILHDFSADSYDNWPPYVTKQNNLMFYTDIKLISKLLGKETLTALECGCGSGKLTLNLVNNGFHVDAVDISCKMVDINREKMNQFNLQKTPINFHVSDVDEFLIKPGHQYDLICFSAVLHHIGDYLKTLKSACTRVSRGGFIYIGGEPQLQKGKTWVHKSIDFLSDKSIIGYKFLKNPGNSIRFVKHAVFKPKTGSKINVTLAEFHAVDGVDDKQIIQLLKDEGFKIICHEPFLHHPFEIFEITNRLYRDGPKNFKIIAQKN
ncbi:MAG: methyltransferase domain-containing protein [Candidatus ainarchaeum sp.]|nr:methyltransferase domain-containing protein [Candidatus ainarchaeum sp.]